MIATAVRWAECLFCRQELDSAAAELTKKYRDYRNNKKFGITARELVLGYYSDPEEAAVVMELKL